MSENPEAFFGWPGWKHLRYALLLSLAGSLWFALVYGGADAFTAHRTFRVRVYFDAELGIPFIPEMALIYMSIYLLFLAAPFILRQRHEFLALAMTLNLVILVSGICFLLFPAQVAFPPPKTFGAFPNLYHFADRLSLNYNLMPSLHVALSVICIAVFAARIGKIGKVCLWTWAVAISASTLFIHKHHVLDVIAGFALALAVYKFIYFRFLQLFGKKLSNVMRKSARK
jgi:membrane-associated phospholipid phosphatase